MNIPNRDALWRTDTGHCIAQTMDQLPGDMCVPSSIRINTFGEAGEVNSNPPTNVTLHLSSTPIVSTIQVVANFSALNGSGGLLSHDIADEHRRRISQSSPSSPEAGRFPDDNPHLIAAVAPLQLPQQQSATLPRVSQKNSLSSLNHPNGQQQSSTFLYRWFHPHDHPSSGTATPHSVSNESLHSTASSTEEGSSSRKHTMVYRLFHPHVQQQQHHGEQSHPQQQHTTESEGIDGHPPHPVDSPQTQRRHALMSKLFHLHDQELHRPEFPHASPAGAHSHTSSTNAPALISSSHGSFSFMHRKKKNTPGSSSNEHSDVESCPSSSRTSSHHSLDGVVGSNEPTDISSNEHVTGSPKNPSSNTSHQNLKATDTQDSNGSRRAFNIFKSLLLPPKGRHASNSGTSSTVGSQSGDSINGGHGHENVLGDRYGFAEKIIGRGAGGVVRLFHKLGPLGPGDRLYAVKEFRKRRKNETEKDYIKVFLL